MENKEAEPEKEDKTIGEKEIAVDDKIVQVIIDDTSGLCLSLIHI